jgi:hypothetical protein
MSGIRGETALRGCVFDVSKASDAFEVKATTPEFAYDSSATVVTSPLGQR